ncbi:serine/threonine protein kinase [Saprolegnia diclina VS20]|uniref:Serine/threonine protein kinase n=1 Tax=Saprolegnia diclina (strain VS20) TaxID=1156394 RepID=T0QT68_SAPDV|nr:serine/threonine protein kinase [Saprolegnia diclina VS20]EQC37901.1 serine/threonine protein kinase [Saprolegnia diclina VS20]|eukprot:XP_008608834.1 serine/threonine protein kinase [Saprolegnia diclina VS20]
MQGPLTDDQRARQETLQRTRDELRRESANPLINLTRIETLKSYMQNFAQPTRTYDKTTMESYEAACFAYDNHVRRTLLHNHRNKQFQAELCSPLRSMPFVLDRYELMELLSTASATTCGVELWKAVDRSTKSLVTLKVSLNLDLLRLEYAAFKSLRFASIVATLPGDGIVSVPTHDGQSVYLFPLEHMHHDLQSVLYTAPGGRLAPFEAREIIFRLCQAIQFLHDEEKVAHCDLRPSHVLIASPPNLDVRLTSVQSIQNRRDTVYHVTSRDLLAMPSRRVMYLSPESFRHWTPSRDTNVETTTNACADIWAIGILLYEMLYGQHPFCDGVLDLVPADKVAYGMLLSSYGLKAGPTLSFPARPDNIHDDAKDFIRQCLAPSAANRPNALALIVHSYLT